MFITGVNYYFDEDKTFVKVPAEIVKETEHCYYTKIGCRYNKNEIGIPELKSKNSYPYIKLVMIDADEDTLREKLSEWFVKKAEETKKGI